MIDNLQAVTIFLLFVLPGYTWTKTENLFRPKHKSEVIDVIARSLSRSILVNVPAIMLVMPWSGAASMAELGAFGRNRPILALGIVGLYATVAMVVGFLCGYLRGAIFPSSGLQEHLVRRGLTRQLESTSVWEDIAVHQRLASKPPAGQVNEAWVIVTFPDCSEVHGKIESYPQIVEEDRPFWFALSVTEVFTASGAKRIAHEEKYAVMVNSSEVRHIAVKYSWGTPTATPTIVGRKREAFLALSTWGWTWVVALGLLASVVVTICVYVD